MGRIYLLELKKICKTKTALAAIVAALLAAVCFIFLVASFESYHYLDENGEMIKVTGKEAINRKKQAYDGYPKEMTSETVKEQFAFYIKMCEQYGDGEFSYEIPRDIYNELVEMAEYNVGSMYRIFQTPQKPNFSALLDPPAEAMDHYYEAWEQYIEDYALSYYPNHPAAAEKAVTLAQKIETPFVSEYGIGVEAMDYVMMMQLILVVVGIIIIAPLFASDYQTRADDIQRCTKYGRIKYALVEIGAGLTVVFGIYVLSLGIYIVGINTVYGWQGLATSIQILGSVKSLMPYTVGGTQIFLAAGGILTTLALFSFILFVSSRSKSPAVTLGAAMVMFLAPMFISMILSGSLADWLTCILPSGGFGFNTGLWIETAYNLTFINIGSLSFYAPHVILAAAGIWSIIFLPGAVISYCRHE